MPKQGSYVLYLDVPHALTLRVGVLKNSLFPAGQAFDTPIESHGRASASQVRCRRLR